MTYKYNLIDYLPEIIKINEKNGYLRIKREKGIWEIHYVAKSTKRHYENLLSRKGIYIDNVIKRTLKAIADLSTMTTRHQ